MVWKKLWRCDHENWWCDQNSDGVKQIYKRVNNILMVWTKLWRCDLENRWCEQKNWWCEHNPNGVNKMYTVWSNNLTVWLKFLTVWSKSLRCEQNVYDVIKNLRVWSKIWRCDQTFKGVIKNLTVWSKLRWCDQDIVGVIKRPFAGNCLITPCGVIISHVFFWWDDEVESESWAWFRGPVVSPASWCSCNMEVEGESSTECLSTDTWEGGLRA